MRRTERTEGVGRAEASELARGPSWRRTAGSVGSAVMPAREALRRLSKDTWSESERKVKQFGSSHYQAKGKVLTVEAVVTRQPVAC